MKGLEVLSFWKLTCQKQLMGQSRRPQHTVSSQCAPPLEQPLKRESARVPRKYIYVLFHVYNVDTLYRKFQSTGLSGRSLEDLVHLVAPSFKLSWKATAKPKRIVYPSDFASFLSEKQEALMEEFVVAWEKALGIKADRMSLADAWAKNPPQDAGKQALDEYLGNVSNNA